MLDPKNTPPDLRDLLPIAEKWDSAFESERVDRVQRASADERRQLCSVVAARGRRIGEWLDSFGEDMLSEEAGALLNLTYAARDAQRMDSPAALAVG